MGLDNIKKRIDGIEEKLGAMPEGREKQLAEFERNCLRDFAETVESVKGATTRAFDKTPALEKLRRSYASLVYIDEAKKSGEPVSVGEIKTKSENISQNDVYRKITLHMFKKSSRDGSTLYDHVPGEERGYHLSGWIKELDESKTPDYSKEFDRLSAGVKDDALKARYIELSDMNECIKGVNRRFAKSPDELYSILTDKAELEKHEKAAKAAEFFKNQEDVTNEIRKLKPKCGNHQNTPVCFVRQYSLFLEQDTSEAAMKRNQEAVDRFCSGEPEDVDFKREFVRESLNKLLSIKDEDLAVRTKEQKLEVCKKYGTLIDGLFDADQNMLDNISKDFYVPKRILNTLKHKVDLLTSNLITVKKEFQNDYDPRYAELKILDGIASDDLSSIMDVSADCYKGTDDPEIKLLLANKVIGVNLREREAANDNTTVLDINPEKYDGYYIMPDEMYTVKEPVKPEKPGLWASFASGMTSFYNSTLGRIFGKAKDPYEEEFKTYEAKMSTYEKQVEDRKKGLAEMERDREIYGNPETREAQEVRDVETKNRRMKAIEAHEASVTKQENAIKEEKRIENDIAYSKDMFKSQLDSVYESLEHRTNGSLNRLDHVMIGHKTLRAHLEEDYVSKNPGSMIYGADNSRCVNYINESLKNGRAEELILGAILDGKKVSYFKPDPDTGVLVKNEETSRYEHYLTLPEDAHLPECERIRELKKQFESINTPSDASERMKMVPDCIDGIFKLNYIGRASLARQNSANIKEQFFGDADLSSLRNPHTFSISRSSLQSHTFAYLMTEKKMTPEQIADKNYLPDVKREAGKHIKEIMTTENGDLGKLAKYNVNGIVKMKEYINSKLEKCDMTKPEQLYSESNKYVFTLSHYIVDLDQEQKCMKEEADKETAKHLPSDVWDKEIRANTIFSGMDDSLKATSLFKTGSIAGGNTKRSVIIQQEVFKKAVFEKVRDGESVFSALDGDEQMKYQCSAIIAASSKKSDSVNSGIEEFVKNTSVNTVRNAISFAKYAESGSIVNDCVIKDGNFSYSPYVEDEAPDIKSEEEIKAEYKL